MKACDECKTTENIIEHLPIKNGIRHLGARELGDTWLCKSCWELRLARNPKGVKTFKYPG